MLRKQIIFFLITVFLYIITNFLNMDVILRTNKQIDKLDYEYEILLDEYNELLAQYTQLTSRSYLCQIAEKKLGLHLPENFEDYAFFQIDREPEGKTGITIWQAIMPTAEAFSTKPPSQLK